VAPSRSSPSDSPGPGLAGRRASTLVEAAACPASDFARDAALLALAARHEDLTRERYEEAVEEGEVVVAYCLRGAIHALAPGDLASSAVAHLDDDEELAAQLGQQVQRLAKDKGFAPTAALDEVAEATKAALANVVRWTRTSCTPSFAGA
jgi:hypothetical protein